MLISFLIFLCGFFAIGLSSVLRSRQTKRDYYLASQSVPAWLVGLSAVATNNSGYMFIGVIGYTYTTGLASIWLMVGWIAGDLIASLAVHGRLRAAADATGEPSYIGVLNHWGGRPGFLWGRGAALLTIIFLTAYASAQLVAGSKALTVLLGWPPWGGAVVGSIIVVGYCMAGGIRASIWTDAAQSFVMIFAMGLLLYVATQELGGAAAAWQAMGEVEGFRDWVPRDLAIPGVAGGLLFALAWLFAGLSVIGQPHVMVRFLALESTGKMVRARAWYYLWFTAFYAAATGVGLLSRLYFGDPGAFDAELALPMMALELLHPVLVGLILAGIFAATMSTADSLVLSCSAAITHDLLPVRVERTLLLKLATVGVTAAALGWALVNKQSVFALVIMSWSALASAFAPILLVKAFGGRPGAGLALAMSLTGVAVALIWRYVLELAGAVYEGMPGILAGLLVYGIGRGIDALGADTAAAPVTAAR